MMHMMMAAGEENRRVAAILRVIARWLAEDRTPTAWMDSAGDNDFSVKGTITDTADGWGQTGSGFYFRDAPTGIPEGSEAMTIVAVMARDWNISGRTAGFVIGTRETGQAFGPASRGRKPYMMNWGEDISLPLAMPNAGQRGVFSATRDKDGLWSVYWTSASGTTLLGTGDYSFNTVVDHIGFGGVIGSESGFVGGEVREAEIHAKELSPAEVEILGAELYAEHCSAQTFDPATATASANWTFTSVSDTLDLLQYYTGGEGPVSLSVVSNNTGLTVDLNAWRVLAGSGGASGTIVVRYTWPATGATADTMVNVTAEAAPVFPQPDTQEVYSGDPGIIDISEWFEGSVDSVIIDDPSLIVQSNTTTQIDIDTSVATGSYTIDVTPSYLGNAGSTRTVTVLVRAALVALSLDPPTFRAPDGTLRVETDINSGARTGDSGVFNVPTETDGGAVWTVDPKVITEPVVGELCEWDEGELVHQLDDVVTVTSSIRSPDANGTEIGTGFSRTILSSDASDGLAARLTETTTRNGSPIGTARTKDLVIYAPWVASDVQVGGYIRTVNSLRTSAPDEVLVLATFVVGTTAAQAILHVGSPGVVDFTGSNNLRIKWPTSPLHLLATGIRAAGDLVTLAARLTPTKDQAILKVGGAAFATSRNDDLASPYAIDLNQNWGLFSMSDGTGQFDGRIKRLMLWGGATGLTADLTDPTVQGEIVNADGSLKAPNELFARYGSGADLLVNFDGDAATYAAGDNAGSAGDLEIQSGTFTDFGA